MGYVVREYKSFKQIQSTLNNNDSNENQTEHVLGKDIGLNTPTADIHGEKLNSEDESVNSNLPKEEGYRMANYRLKTNTLRKAEKGKEKGKKKTGENGINDGELQNILGEETGRHENVDELEDSNTNLEHKKANPQRDKRSNEKRT